MAKTLKVVWNLDNAKTATFSLADPKTGLTQSEVDTFTGYAITNSLFAYSGSSGAPVYPVSVKESYIYETAKTPLA